MKRIVGSPGKWSGKSLRVLQCVFAAASFLVMVSSLGFSNYSAYFYMILALILQLMWSMALACLDIFSLRNKKDFHAPNRLLLIVIIDWVAVILTFSGACGSAALTIVFVKDLNICGAHLACGQFALSVTLAFITWSLQAVSSFSGLWLLVSFF